MNLQSPGATKILGSLALVVPAVAGWLLVLGPQAGAISDTQQAVVDARDQNGQLQAQLVTLRKQELELEATVAEDRVVEELFPRTADQPGLFRGVSSAAARAGIPPAKVTTLAPSVPTLGDAAAGAAAVPTSPAEADLARQIVTIAVESDFSRTQRMLANLEDMPRAYLVTSLTVGVGSAPGTFLTTVTGDMFVMPPAPRP